MPLFLLSLLSFFYLAMVLTRLALRPKNLADWLGAALPLFLAVLLISLGVSGRIFHSLVGATFAGASLSLLAALLLQRGLRRPSEPWTWGFEIQMGDMPLILVFLVSTLGIAIVALRYTFFDENFIQGHLWTIEALRRGEFPPSFAAFPQTPLHYHYGFDLLAAIFCRAFALSADRGLDVATIFCWISVLWILVLFLLALGVPRKFLGLTLAFILLAGGFSWFLAKAPPGYNIAPEWQLSFLFRRKLHQNFVSYFYQHPIAMGLPIFTGTLHYFKAWFEEKRRPTLVIATLLLGALSLAQVMLFLTLLAALGLVFFLRFFARGISKRENFWDGLTVGLMSLALAFLLGGFFQFVSGDQGSGVLFSWPPGYLLHENYGSKFPISFLQSLQWYLSGFGFVLILAPCALFYGWKRKDPILQVLILFCLMGFLVPQFFHYRYSWDIIKWFLGFEFSAKILIAVVFLPWIGRIKWLQALAYAAVVFSMVTPFNFLFDLSFKSPSGFTGPELNVAAAYSRGAFLASDHPIFKRWRETPQNYGRVWGSYPTSLRASAHTGYPMVQVDWVTQLMPLDRKILNERLESVKVLEKNPSLELLQKQKVRWILFTCEEANALPTEVRQFWETAKTQFVSERVSSEEGCMETLDLHSAKPSP